MAKLCLLFCLLMTLSTCYGHLGFIGDIISGAREKVHNDIHKVATAVGGVLSHGANLNIGGHVKIGHGIAKPIPENNGESVVVIIDETTGGSEDNGYQDAKGYGIPNHNGYNYHDVPNTGLNYGHQSHHGHGYHHHHGGYGHQHSAQGNFQFGGNFHHGSGYNQQGYRPNPSPHNNHGGYGQPHQAHNHGYEHVDSNKNNNNSPDYPADNITPSAPTQNGNNNPIGPTQNNNNNMNQNNYGNPQNLPNNNVQSTTQKTDNNKPEEDNKRPIWPSNNDETTKKPNKNDEPLFVPLNPNEYNYEGDKIQVKEPKRETQDKKPADEDEEFPIDVRFKDE